MAMVRRWAIFRVDEEFHVQVGSHPNKGLAAMEALRLADCTGMAHHVAEQIISRHAALQQQIRPLVGRRV